MPTYDYAIRVTLPYQECKQAMGLWATKCEKLIVYEHVGDRTQKIHIHIGIKGSILEARQLKNIFAELCPQVAGNLGLYSRKEWDGEMKYITYMTKGQYDPVYNKEYTIEYIDEAKAKWVRPTAYEKVSKAKELLEKFYTWYYDRHGNLQDVTGFFLLRPRVKEYVYVKFGQCWDIPAMNAYKMIMRTVIYSNNIVIPPEEKSWNW